MLLRNKGKVPKIFINPNNQYYGFSKDGRIKIEFYYGDNDGSINSFFPSLSQY